MSLSSLDHVTVPSHCIWNETHTPYPVCKPYPTWSCLPRHLLSHHSLLPRHCSQAGLPPFLCRTERFPCPDRCTCYSLCWLCLSFTSECRADLFQHTFPDGATAVSPPPLCRQASFTELQICTYLVCLLVLLTICSTSLSNPFSSLNT